MFPCIMWPILFLLVSVSADCIWYGIGDRSNPSHPRYKSYTGPPIRLEDHDAFKKISKLCPAYSPVSDPLLCCDKEQVDFFADSVQRAAMLLHRCPACWSNFRSLFCAMTCAPNQTDFLTPTVMGDLVFSVEYRLTNQVAGRFYNSCKDVQFNNVRAIDPICGSECSPDKLLTKLGTGPDSPFPVNFVIVPEDDRSSGVFNETFRLCNESVPRAGADPGGPRCTCADCEATCIPPTPPPEKHWPTIFGIDAWWVGSFFALSGLVVLFATFEFVNHICRNRHRQTTHVKLDQEILNSDAGCLGQIQAKLEGQLYRAFAGLGRCIAGHPYMTLVLSILVSVGLSSGLVFFTVTTNPVQLWSGPRSRSRLEKEHFDKSFAPFYRTEQLIIRPCNQSFFRHANLYPASGYSLFGPALKKDFLLEVLQLQNELRDFSVYSEEFKQNLTLSDLCFKPLEPDNTKCAIASPLEYFQSDLDKINFVLRNEDFPELIIADYLDHLLYCTNSPMSVSGSTLNASFGCLGSSGMPILPQLALGGFEGTTFRNATSVVLSYIVKNDADPNSVHIRKAEQWEAAYLKRIDEWAKQHTNLATVSYQAERSVEDEINRQSEADVFTVLMSYLVMFVYVSIFLASYRGCRTLFVDLRVTLGLGGVIIVLVSVVASVGLWSYLGTPATLIIIEVIPFLVLAVGVDNIFILVHDFDFDEQDADKLLRAQAEHLHIDSTDTATQRGSSVKALVQARIARTLGRVGPSMLLSSSAEAVAFFCGSLTTMPAVRLFALYAGMAIVFNFLLQIFAFVALLTLDARRRAANRFDVLCCLRSSAPLVTDSHANPVDTLPIMNEVDSLSLTADAWDDVQLTAQNTFKQNTASVPWLHKVVAHVFTPFILSGWMRPVIVLISLTWACFCFAIMPRGLHIGLDQRLSMPEDSYVLHYFNALASDLRIGPPVYFVVTAGHKYTNQIGQNDLCSTVGCPQDSLLGRITDAAKLANYTGIAQPASSWLDDYFDWVNPDISPRCCRIHKDSDQFCSPDESNNTCVACPVNIVDGRPVEQDFMKYLTGFLQQNPGINCAKAGRAAYRTAINFSASNQLGATYFMTYHTVLSQPDDYINALRGARQLAQQINDAWHRNESGYSPDQVLAPNTVYPYSVFYVFYEQYLTVTSEASIQIGICLAAITIVTFILLGLNFTATLMVLFGLLFMVLSMLGMMVLWQIDLNALSLVNLVVTVGIGVEFCAHIVRAFVVSVEPTRLQRAKAALTNMGSSILRGITLTKLGGIIVLCLSKSRLFQVFYFRMYLGIILFGAYTGLILLPVALSYFGPGLNKHLARKHMEGLREQNAQDMDYDRFAHEAENH